MPFQISFDYPIWKLAIVLLAGLIYAAILYYKNTKEPYSQLLKIILFLFRFTTVSCIALLLLSPFIRQTHKQIEQPTIILAQDNSASISMTADSNYYKNTFRLIIDSLTHSLKDKYTIDTYTFGKDMVKNQAITYDAQQTNISQVIQTIHYNYINRNIGAIILLSDGIYNQGINPIYNTQLSKIPVICVGLGDTVEHPDLSIFELRYNKKVNLKSDFTIEATIRATQMSGKSATIELFDNDKIIVEKKITISTNKFSSTQYFTLNADSIGYKKLILRIVTNSNESNFQNNERIFYTEVINKKYKILIWSKAPHPDIAAIKSALSENEETVIRFGKDNLQSDDKFDLIILHQLPSKTIDFQIINKLLEANDQSPVLFITGSESDFSSFNSLQQTFRLEADHLKTIESVPVLNETFGLFQTIEFDMNQISHYPPLISPFGEYLQNIPSSALFYQKIKGIDTKLPQISFSIDDKHKTAYIFGTGIWRWRLSSFNEKGNTQSFDQIIQKSISFLLAENNDQPLQILVNESVSQSEDVRFKGLLFNKSSELVNDPELSIEITNSNSNEVYPFTFARSQNGYELNAGHLPIGSYSFDAFTVINGEKIDAKGKFTIEKSSIEGLNLLADHHLLHRIATQSGGLFVPLDSLQLISQWLDKQNTITSVSHFSETFQPIINHYWTMILLILLLFVEWLLRKIYGSY